MGGESESSGSKIEIVSQDKWIGLNTCIREPWYSVYFFRDTKYNEIFFLNLSVYFPLFIFISLMAHNPNRSETYRYGSSQWGHGYNVRPYNATDCLPSGSRFPLF